jgi:hypothetical protein
MMLVVEVLAEEAKEKLNVGVACRLGNGWDGKGFSVCLAPLPVWSSPISPRVPYTIRENTLEPAVRLYDAQRSVTLLYDLGWYF